MGGDSMPKPRAPTAVLRTWLALSAHVIGLGALFDLYESSFFKFGVVGVDFLVPLVIVSVYLGQLRQWHLSARHVRELERENYRLRDVGVSGSPEQYRRQPERRAA